MGTRAKAKSVQPKQSTIQTLGDFVRQERKNRGLTLAEMGEKLHITAQFVHDIERGRRYPSKTVLESLADVLETPVEAFQALDTRYVLWEFKQLAERSPVLRAALSRALTEIKEARITPDDLARRITDS